MQMRPFGQSKLWKQHTCALLLLWAMHNGHSWAHFLYFSSITFEQGVFQRLWVPHPHFQSVQFLDCHVHPVSLARLDRYYWCPFPIQTQSSSSSAQRSWLWVTKTDLSQGWLFHLFPLHRNYSFGQDRLSGKKKIIISISTFLFLW